MRDGSDAIADWPVLNALLNTSSGATWVSVHHGGGVGIGYSLHAGMVVVADGTREADEKLRARADHRSRHRRRAARRRRLSRSASPRRAARGIRDPDARPRRRSRAVIVERPGTRTARPGLARRRPDSRRARRLRRRPHVAAACGSSACSARTRAQYLDFARGGDDAGTVPRAPSTARSRAAAGRAATPPPPATPRAAFDALLAFFDRARGADGSAGDVSARRGPRHPDVRELPRLAPRPARSHRAPGREPGALRARVALHRARASAAPRRAGALRSRARAAARRRRKSRRWPLRGRRRAPRRGPRDAAPQSPRSSADAPRTRTCCSTALASHGAVRRSGGGAGRAVRARRPAHRALPRELRVPSASRARLRRAQGDPRHPRRRRAAEPDRDRAAPAAHAGLDQGLSVVARGRRPDQRRRASATRSRTRCCACTCGSTAARCRRPTTTSCARSAPTRRRVCRTASPCAGAGRRGGRSSGAGRRASGIIEID